MPIIVQTSGLVVLKLKIQFFLFFWHENSGKSYDLCHSMDLREIVLCYQIITRTKARNALWLNVALQL